MRLQPNNSLRVHKNDEEHQIQCACVNWFRCEYPSLSGCLFAVPNGGRRDAVTGAKMKAEGVLAGVSDLILLEPNRHFHALLIEMKTQKGKQSAAQKAFENNVSKSSYFYAVAHSLEEFMRIVKHYLDN